MLDLDLLHRPWCEMLRGIWSPVPRVFEGGRRSEMTPPERHECAR